MQKAPPSGGAFLLTWESLSVTMKKTGGVAMNFMEIAQTRQSCRSFAEMRPVEQEKLEAVLEAARLAPSACNGQPYHFTVCRGEKAKEVAKTTMGMGMNKFATSAPVMIVISEVPYVKSAAVGSKVTGTDYRSIDMGIAAAYLTAEAAAQGLATCILGWLDDKKLRSVCGQAGTARLVIALGYANPDDQLRPKKRKSSEELITWLPE
jgi:nitroreductase